MSSEPGPSESTAVAAGAEAGWIHGRYEVLRPLGQGGMGSVFLVRDHRAGGRLVALKQVELSGLDRAAVEVLRNEFRALGALQHPGLARVHDFGVDRRRSGCFFTSEFVDGANLLESVRRLDLRVPSGLDAFEDLIAQVLRALEFIHSRGLVHGDIKPENVLVAGLGADPPREPTAKLIDFGLTRREKDFVGRNVLGTLHYVAPETVSGSQVDRRTDLYSLGCVLYHVLTGRPPFGGATGTEVLRGHLERTPERPASLAPFLPEATERLVLRLMEKRPSDRFRDATEALAALAERSGRPFPIETPETARSYVASARAPNGDGILSVLRAALRTSTCPGAEARRPGPIRRDDPSAGERRGAPAPKLPEGRLIVLRGERGAAMDPTIDGFRRHAQVEGARFLEVPCGDARDGTMELGLLLDEVRTLVRGEGPLAVAIDECAGLGPGAAEDDPDRALGPLDALARRILEASVDEPIVVHLRDLHRARAPMIAFVRVAVDLQVRKVLPPSQLLLTATAGSQRDLEGTRLQGLFRSTSFREATLQLELPRLDRDGIERFVDAAFEGNDFPGGFVSRLRDESGGDSGVLSEILASLAASGLIERRPRGWRLARDPTETDFPLSTRAELAARWDRLAPRARKLGTALAVLGPGTDLELAARVAGLSREEVLESMKALHEAQLVEGEMAASRPGVYSCAHPLVAEIARERVPAEIWRTFHHLAGRLLLEAGPEKASVRPDTIALHFLRAGDRDEALRLGPPAARALAASPDPRPALALYGDLVRVAEEVDPALGRQLAHEKALVHQDLGQYRESLELLAPLTEDRIPDGRAPHPTRVLTDAAAACVRLGEHDRAAAYLRRAAEIERSQLLPVSMVRVLLGYAELAAVLRRWKECEGYCAQLLEDRERIHDTALLLRLNLLLADAHEAAGRLDLAAGSCRDALRVIDSDREGRYTDVALRVLGRRSRLSGKYLQAAAQLRLAVSLGERRGSLDGLGLSCLELGRVERHLQRPCRAAAALEQARRAFEDTGDTARSAQVLGLLGEIHAGLGELDDARQRLTESMQLARRARDACLEAENAAVCAGICLDRGDGQGFERYLSAAAPAGATDAGPKLRVFALRARACFETGGYDESLQHLIRGLDVAEERRLPTWEVAFLERKSMVEIQLGVPGRAVRSIDSCREKARRHGLVSSTARCDLLEGMAAAADGRREEGARLFRLALRVFREENSERDLLRLYLAHGTDLLEAGHGDQALLYLEECGYLARKLGLSYWKARAWLALGTLDAASSRPEGARAGELFDRAASLASRCSYLDVLWRCLFQRALVERRAGSIPSARSLATRARETLGRVVSGLATSHREGFLAASPVLDLDRLLSDLDGAKPG